MPSLKLKTGGPLLHGQRTAFQTSGVRIALKQQLCMLQPGRMEGADSCGAATWHMLH